jgi:hypothetical protein
VRRGKVEKLCGIDVDVLRDTCFYILSMLEVAIAMEVPLTEV